MTSVFGDFGLTRGQVGTQLQGGYVSGMWYPTTEEAVAPVAATAADTLYLYPFRFYSPATVSALGVRVTTTGAGSAAKLAWWAHSPATGRPTGLPITGSNTGLDTSGSNGYKDITGLSRIQPPAIVWAGIVMTGTMAAFMSATNASAARSAMMGNASAIRPYGTSATTQRTGVSIAQTYANDIMALDLTGATFTELSGTQIPAQTFQAA